MRAILAALSLCLVAVFCNSAHAHNRYVTQAVPNSFDAAAVQTYPIEQSVHHVYRHHASHEHRQAKRRSQQERHTAPKTVATAFAKGNPGASPPDWQDGISTPHPIVITESRPHRLEGVLRIAGTAFDFVSGGIKPSIPYGNYEISTDSEGDWGARHGALDLTGTDRGEIWDPQLGRHREGIELHGGGYATEGCVAVKQWPRAKHAILAMIHAAGRAFLHVWPGSVTITPMRSSGQVIVALHQSIARDRVARAERRPHHQRRYARHRYRHYTHA